MTVYVIAQLRFTDRSAYNRYQNRFLGVQLLGGSVFMPRWLFLSE